MRKWAPKGRPDDPNIWLGLDGFLPTKRGTYESVPVYSSTAMAATSAGTCSYAFAGATTTGSRSYVVSSTKIWEESGGALTDRTGGVTIGTNPMMVNYGNITLCAMGNATNTVSSSGGNFAALAGSPKAEIILVARNAAVALNTDTSGDGWATSDVGDYTNWSSGESASGRLLQTPGAIIGGVVLGDDVIVFKTDAIYRGQYVGNAVKWRWDVIWRGQGMYWAGTALGEEKYQVGVGGGLILFAATSDPAWYLFDGVNAPHCCSALQTFNSATGKGRVVYDPLAETFCCSHITSNLAWEQSFYCVPEDKWGIATGSVAASGFVPILGEFVARGARTQPLLYKTTATNTITKYTPSATGSSAIGGSVTTQRVGKVGRKTQVFRVTPVHRARTVISGSPAMLLTPYVANEIYGADVAGSNVSESGFRNRFDFSITADFQKFQVVYPANLYVELDEIAVDAKDAGAN